MTEDFMKVCADDVVSGDVMLWSGIACTVTKVEQINVSGDMVIRYLRNGKQYYGQFKSDVMIRIKRREKETA